MLFLQLYASDNYSRFDNDTGINKWLLVSVFRLTTSHIESKFLGVVSLMSLHALGKDFLKFP